MENGTGRISDPRLPGLALALSEDGLLELLSDCLPECRAGARILGGRVVDVQYSPGRLARVLWKVTARDAETGRKGRQLVYAQAMRWGDAMPAEPVDLVERYRALRERKGVEREMPLRTPWVSVPGPRLVVCAFPLDPGLPTLLDVMDPGVMKAALGRVWRSRRVAVRKVRAEILSYTPGARAALRIEVLAEDRDTGIPELRRLVGKLHARRSPPTLFAGHWAVWRRSLGRVAIAPPVGYVATAELSLQEFLTGTRLSDLAGRAAFPALLRETARGIGNVHSQLLPLLAVRGASKELAAIDRWVRILSRLRPAYAGRISALGDRLRREVAARTCLTGTVHADFHMANVLADQRGVTLIDWDQVAHGDPMVDVGRVLASLRVSALRVHGTLSGFADEEESFLRAYLDHTGEDERRARLFEAASLLIAAGAPFRLQREGWEEGAELMLEEVERVLALSLAGPRSSLRGQKTREGVPFEERLGWALDRSYAQALLVPLMRKAHGPDLEVTECLPSVKRSSREHLHVRWHLKGYKGSTRWHGAVEGLGFSENRGRGRLRRLELVTRLLAEHPEALRLPRLLGELAPLSMVAFLPAEGGPLTDLLGTEGEAEALERLAGALAGFHSLDIDLRKERETGRDLRAVARRVEDLKATGHPAASAARELLRSVEEATGAIGERRLPTITSLHVRHVRMDDRGPAASVVHDVVWAEPLLTTGGLSAQLRSLAIARGVPASAADRFGRAYADASGDSPRDIAGFEALTLLEEACRRGERNPVDPLVELLIGAGFERIGGVQ